MPKDIEFEDWYHTEWIEHIRDSGGIKAQLKLLTWMVGTLLVSNAATVGYVIKVSLE